MKKNDMSKGSDKEPDRLPQVIRWSVDRAAAEFGIDRRPLERRLVEVGAKGGVDKKFSTAEICAAVFGDLKAEKLRAAKEDADRKWLANEKEKGNLIEKGFMVKKMMDVFVVVRQKIMSFPNLLDEEKNQLLNEIRSLKP